MSAASEHDRILQGLVAGDFSADAPPAREHLEGCMQCQGRWEELASARADLERDGAFFRAVSGEATAGTATADERAAMERFERTVLASPSGVASAESPRAARRWSWMAVPLVAAAAAVLYFALRPGPEPGPDKNGSVSLGAANIHILGPRGDVKSFDAIEWTADVALDQRVELTIEGRSEGERERSLVDRIDRATSPWKPTPAFVARRPVEIWYRIRVLDQYSVFDTSEEVHAQLSSH